MKRTLPAVAVFLAALVSAALPFATRAGTAQKKSRVAVVAGDPSVYRAPEPAPEARAEMEKKLGEARALYERNKNDADALIWLGRRTAYLGRFDEAIAIFGEGVKKHPRDARMYRHRGHRHLTTRRFDAAVKDLELAARLVAGRADEVEPDGQPNARGIPTSTLNSNIWYHLGLAYYVRGDLRNALRAYRECMKFSQNADMQAATSHWLYMTLRRLKRDEEAGQVLDRVRDDAEVIENQDYQRLLMLYKGKVKPNVLLAQATWKADSVGYATVAYGVGNFYLYTGQPEKARRTFVEIVETSPQRTSFGYIAAEAELQRLGLRRGVDYLRSPPPRVIR